MTYVLAAALQEAVYGRLTADPSIDGLIGSAVFDAAPAGQVPPLYVALGPEDVRDRSDKTAHAALHVLTVTIVSEGGGFHAAKVLAAAVEEALTVMPLSLSRGRVIAVTFDRADARRDRNGKQRRIDMRFRALVDDT